MTDEKEVLANSAGCVILFNALNAMLAHVRAERRAKLAEVASLERLEQTFLTQLKGLHQPTEVSAPPV